MNNNTTSFTNDAFGQGRQPSHRVDVSGLVGWAVGHAKSKQKCESRTNLVQDLHKTVPRARRSKIRPAPVTTEGDKMKVSASVKAQQRIAHKRKKQTAEKSKTAPLNTKGCGTRRVSTKGNTRMIYSFSVSTKNIVKKSLRHPPAITTEGDEVEIAASVEALQGVAHGKVWDNAKSKTAPLKSTRDAAPILTSATHNG